MLPVPGSKYAWASGVHPKTENNARINIDDFFREHNYRNWKYSFTDFYAVLNYQIPKFQLNQY